MAIIELIDESIVRAPLAATTREGAIRELIDALVASGRIANGDMAYQAVLDREAKGSTGLAGGVAVPHGKTTATSSLALAIGVSPKGIDFGALDGKPPRIFFLMLAPPDKAGPHIEALAEIARMSRSKAFLATLAEARSPAAVVGMFKDD